MLVTAVTTEAEAVHSDFSRLPSRQVRTNLLRHPLVAGTVRTIEAKEHIFREGDAVCHVYMVEVGNICVYKSLPDGRRQVIDFAYPGDLIGLGAVGEHANNAQATTRARVRRIPISTLQLAIREGGRLGLELYEALSHELQASRDLLFAVSQRTATERVAAFLVALSRRNERSGGDPRDFVLPMTRGDIADYLGLTIETVSRTFTKLRNEGLIELEQCVIVTIADGEALAMAAEGRTR